AAPVLDLFTGDDRPLDGEYTCADRFAEHFMGQPHDRHIEYGRMRMDPVLHFARVHVEPAANDHFLAAPDDVEETVLVQHAEITRQEIAFIIERLRRFTGLAVVALHHAGATDGEFAQALLGQHAAIEVEHANAHGRQWPSHREVLLRGRV